MEKTKKPLARRILKVLMWAFLVIIGLYLILVAVRVAHLFNVDKTNAQVEKIHSTKLTMDDVEGKNLPPDPGADADKTIQGIDANKNGIRDDVELAVFKEYPNSAKTRAVLLQYALALQMETMQPFMNTTIATEVAREQGRAFVCIGDIFSRDNLKVFGEKTDILTKFVEDRQHDTTGRKDFRSNFSKQVRSFSGMDRICDIDYSKLSN